MLANKLALITGASSGIGLATARVFAREGAKVFATGRSEAALEKLAREIGCGFLAADLTSEGACKKVVDAAVAYLGGLTTLVNSAGVLAGGAMGSEKCDLANFKFNFSVNVQATFEMMNEAIPHLRAQGKKGQSVVNISSVNGSQSFPGCATYCASKAALDQLSRCAALDLSADGIRVNVVSPGVVVTPLQMRGGMTEDAYADFLKRSVEVTHPLAKSRGEVAKPDEVGDLVAFLASDKAAFITAEVITIDGGRGRLGAR